MARKSIRIAELIDLVNRRNKESTCAPEVREGWNSMLERILHDNDAYTGFAYLGAENVPAGQKPGIAYTSSFATAYPDKTRVYYYTNPKLEG